MSFSGSLIQNAIYIAQQPPEWPISAGDWERAAEAKLDPGAFGYIAGGAGAESTVRANLDAFERRPNTSTEMSRTALPVSIRGRIRQRSNASRFARMVDSAPAPPAM